MCTLGYALLNDVVGAEHIGKATGYTSVALSLGLFMGPVIGGVLYEYGGYFRVFFPAFCLITVEMILRVAIIEPENRRHGTSPSQKVSDSIEAPHDSGTAERLQPGTGVDEQPLLSNTSYKNHRHAFSMLLCSPRFLVAVMSLFVLNNIACGFDGVLAPYIKIHSASMQCTQQHCS